MRKRLCLMALVLGSAAACGCYERVSNDGRVEFYFPVWVVLLGILVTFAFPITLIALLNWHKCFQADRLPTILFMIVGALFVGMSHLYRIIIERVVVDEEGFYCRYGEWWDVSTYQIYYDELVQVRVVVEAKRGRHGWITYKYYLDCSFKSGKQERVAVGSLMLQALPDILKQLRRHGVPVDIPPDIPDELAETIALGE
jgi:hypothetical protein